MNKNTNYTHIIHPQYIPHDHPMTIPVACASASAAACSARLRLPEPMGPLSSNAVRLAMPTKRVFIVEK